MHTSDPAPPPENTNIPSDLPIACSLTADELPKRLAEMADIGAADLLTSYTSGGQALLRFRRRPSTQVRLEAIVAAESECCSFLAMELRDAGDEVELTVTAPAGAEPVLEDIVAAFASAEQAA
jgi:hypothetical protein